MPPARNPNGPRFLLLKPRLSTSPRRMAALLVPVHALWPRATTNKQTTNSRRTCPLFGGTRPSIPLANLSEKLGHYRKKHSSYMFMLSHGCILMYLNNSLTYGPMKKYACPDAQILATAKEMVAPHVGRFEFSSYLRYQVFHGKKRNKTVTCSYRRKMELPITEPSVSF